MTNKIFALLIFFFVAFSFWPSIYELLNQNKIQPNRHFELIHNYYTDYNFYLSRIREGLEGNLLVTEKYTSEPHQGSFVQIFYLALGWVGHYVSVPWDRPGDVYHVARIVFGILLLVAIAEFAKKSFPVEGRSGKEFFGDARRSLSYLKSFFSLRSVKSRNLDLGKSKSLERDFSASQNSFSRGLTMNFERLTVYWPILAFLLAVTASSWPILVTVGNSWPAGNAWQSLAGWRFGGYMAWWSIMDSLQRITFVPHILVGQALIVILLMLLSGKKVNRGINSIYVGILGLILGFIFPPGLYFIYAVLGVLFVFDLLFDRKQVKESFNSIFVFGIVSVPSIIYFLMMMTVYPWKRLVEFDVLNPTSFDYLVYFKAVGPVLIFGTIGGILALAKKEKIMFVSVAWVATWLAFLIIFHFIPQQSPLRFSEVAPQIPLAILAAYLFFLLSKKLAKLGYLALLVLLVLILLGLTQMYSSWLWQKDFIDQKLRASWPLMAHDNYIMYPLNDYVEAMVWLEVNTPRMAVVLSLPETGNYIPVYSGNTVYLGHANTVHAEEKLVIAKRFFSGDLTPNEAQKWLITSGINYVILGPDEQELHKNRNFAEIYTFLREVYRNPQFIIYSVQ